MLHVYNIKKTYRKIPILNNISFDVKPGEIIGLVGENGAGKSTLLKVIATLIKPTNGMIHLDSLHFQKNRKKVRKQIGYVPQDIAIWDNLTVKENMLFFEKLSWKKKNLFELEQLCLDMKLNKWHDSVRTLSGGQKRKLNMAISLIHDPSLLLLDEPTVGIDMKSKQEIAQYLKKRVAEQGLIVLYTTHDMLEIDMLCKKVICIGKDPFYQNILEKSNKEILSF